MSLRGNSVLGIVALLLLVAGCGGRTASPGGAPTATGDEMARLVRYSACMRSHGLPAFPDPDGQGRIRLRVGSGPSSPLFEAADRACRSLLPGGGVQSAAEQAQQRARLLVFAACMRKHGLPGFPDPNSRGEFPSSIGGIVKNKAQFRAAEKACPQP